MENSKNGFNFNMQPVEWLLDNNNKSDNFEFLKKPYGVKDSSIIQLTEQYYKLLNIDIESEPVLLYNELQQFITDMFNDLSDSDKYYFEQLDRFHIEILLDSSFDYGERRFYYYMLNSVSSLLLNDIKKTPFEMELTTPILYVDYGGGNENYFGVVVNGNVGRCSVIGTYNGRIGIVEN